MKKMKQNLIEMCDSIKCTNVHLMGVPERQWNEGKVQKKYLKK